MTTVKKHINSSDPSRVHPALAFFILLLLLLLPFTGTVDTTGVRWHCISQDTDTLCDSCSKRKTLTCKKKVFLSPLGELRFRHDSPFGRRSVVIHQRTHVFNGANISGILQHVAFPLARWTCNVKSNVRRVCQLVFGRDDLLHVVFQLDLWFRYRSRAST